MKTELGKTSAASVLSHKTPNLQSTPDLNQLPLNLFHKSSEYNKIIITNGKSLQSKDQIQLQGFYNSLEFINKPLFEQTEQKNIERKINLPTQSSIRKRGQSASIQCCCCCCDEYCRLCAEGGKKKNRKQLSQIEFKEVLEKMDKKIRQANRKKKYKVKDQNFGKRMSVDILNQKGKKSSYLKKKHFQIDALICNSLIKFEERKREDKVQQLRMKKEKQEKIKQLTTLNDRIKHMNQEDSHSRSGSCNQPKSPTKADIRLNYWNEIKDEVTAAIIKQKLKGGSNSKKQRSLDTKVKCDHSPKIPAARIQELRKKHEHEAKLKIKQKRDEKLKETKKITKNLKIVMDEQKKVIDELPKKKFKPSEEMIKNAFSVNF